MTGNRQSDLLRGTLDLLVLAALARQPLHGTAIVDRIRLVSQDVFRVNDGSLYPALQRLKGRGLIRGDWRTTRNGRQARYYSLTTAGQQHLARAGDEWRRTSRAVDRFLHLAATDPS